MEHTETRPQPAAARPRRKTRVGVVVSDKMDKTVVVQVETLRRHPLYGKTVRHVRRFKAHNEGNAARQGDRVLIMETRPLSREKRWRVVRVVEKAR
jgi:small subunit ribosomal protein S17